MSCCIKVGIIHSELTGTYPHHKLDSRLSFPIPNAFWIKKKRRLFNWDGKHHFIRLSADKAVFPTGLLSKVCKLLKKYDCPYEIIRKDTPAWTSQLDKATYNNSRNNLYPDQREVVKLALRKQRGVLELATGWGKSRLISSIAESLFHAGCPLTLIILHKEKLLKQTSQDLQELTGLPIGIIGEDVDGIRKKEVLPITIAMIQTLYAHKDEDWVKDLLQRTGALIFDEGHHANAKTWKTIASMTPNAPVRLALSGSIFDENDHIGNFELMGVTGPLLKRVTAQDMLSLTDHDGNPRIAWPSVKMYTISVPILSPDIPYATAYKTGVTENLVMAKLIIHLTDKYAKRSRKILTLVEHRKHLDLLTDAMGLRDYPFTYGFATGIDTKGGDIALGDFKQDRIQNLLATTTLEEGINVPAIDVLIRGGGLKTLNKTKQQIGRALRVSPGKKPPIIIDFLFTNHPILQSHAEKRLLDYKKLGWSVTTYSAQHVAKILGLNYFTKNPTIPKIISKTDDLEEFLKDTLGM